MRGSDKGNTEADLGHHHYNVCNEMMMMANLTDANKHHTKEYPMLPPRPVSSTSTEAVEVVGATAPVAAATGGKVVLKKFGPSHTGEGESKVIVDTPTAAGLSLVALSASFYAALTNEADKAGITLQSIIDFCSSADKSQFPGHKNGRIAYATANTVHNLAKMNGLANKVKGLGGGAAMKAKLADKEAKIASLQAQLAEVLAKLNGTNG